MKKPTSDIYTLSASSVMGDCGSCWNVGSYVFHCRHDLQNWQALLTTCTDWRNSLVRVKKQ